MRERADPPTIAFVLVRIESTGLTATACRTRIPFRFGAVTLRDATICKARVEIDSDFGKAVGFAADLCVPKWFEKDPAKTATEDVAALIGSAREAATLLADPNASGSTAFAHWLRIWRARVESCDPGASDRLVRGFGVALCERALLDATCRAAGVSFFEALRAGLFGFDPGALHEELVGWRLAAALPTVPRDRITLRHTVGMLDPLVGAAAPTRIDDGLPEALDEDIRRYGLRAFKLKVGAGPDDDVARLVAIADVLRREVDGEVMITLDGNEQYPDLATLASMLRRLGDDERGRYVLDALRYIEQPLARAETFDPERNAAIDEVRAFCPVIIDEADSGLESFGRAHALGYRGISVKNCKGVFRALANRGLCAAWADGSFQSAEDLTNLGVLSLQQDLATIAALDLAHAERNGHHYFRGLDHLSADEIAVALQHHPDLYEPLDGGPFPSATLRVRDGVIECGSIQTPGYAHK